MPVSHFQRAIVTGLHAVAGPELRRIEELAELYENNTGAIERLKRTIGLDRRQTAPVGVTALDLGAQAARKLLEEMKVEAAGVDGLVFVTQSPDHFQPCNAALLHARLGLGKNVAAFDVNLGCSGFVYGLYLASLMVESGGCARVLLVAADTLSQTVNPRDRALAPMFGDAAGATLVERLPADAAPSPSHYALFTDGAGAGAIQMSAGAFREPPGDVARVESPDAEGNIRSRANLYMNGAEVMAFTLREVPSSVREVLASAGIEAADVDAFILHQANRYILSVLAKHLRVPAERVPMDIAERFGNPSSASIPLTACVALAERLRAGPLRVALAGFGVGLSWAAAAATWGPLRACGWSLYEAETPPGEKNTGG